MAQGVIERRLQSLILLCGIAFLLGGVGKHQRAVVDRQLELFIHAHGRRIDCQVRSYMIQPVSGYLVAELRPAFDGGPHADVPFGVEPRDLADEPFSPDIVERANIRPFWGQSWGDYSDGDRGVAILSQPGLFGYRVADGAFQHILLKTIAPGCQAGARWGNDTRTVTVNGARLELDLGPWEIVTISLA